MDLRSRIPPQRRALRQPPTRAVQTVLQDALAPVTPSELIQQIRQEDADVKDEGMLDTDEQPLPGSR